MGWTLRALIRELIKTTILALLVFLGLQLSVQNFRVEGPSMQPTLGEGKHLLVNKLVYLHFDPQKLNDLLPFIDVKRTEAYFPIHSPSRGEVIIFHFPQDHSRDFVKRVIGLPGETVEVRKGRVFIDDKGLDEPYLDRLDQTSSPLFTVPADSYFVMGDNRPFSNDSRSWGAVPMDVIVGRAWVSYWPLNPLHALGDFGGTVGRFLWP